MSSLIVCLFQLYVKVDEMYIEKPGIITKEWKVQNDEMLNKNLSNLMLDRVWYFTQKNWSNVWSILKGEIRMGLIIIFVIILSLWSVTKTLEKMTDKIIETQHKQNELLEKIHSKLEEKTDE